MAKYTLSDEQHGDCDIDRALAGLAALRIRVDQRQGDPRALQHRIGTLRQCTSLVGSTRGDCLAVRGGGKHDDHEHSRSRGYGRNCDDGDDDACCGAIGDDHLHCHGDAEAGKDGCILFNGLDDDEGNDDEGANPLQRSYFVDSESDGEENGLDESGDNCHLECCGAAGAIIDHPQRGVPHHSEPENKGNDVAFADWEWSLANQDEEGNHRDDEPMDVVGAWWPFVRPKEERRPSQHPRRTFVPITTKTPPASPSGTWGGVARVID